MAEVDSRRPDDIDELRNIVPGLNAPGNLRPKSQTQGRQTNKDDEARPERAIHRYESIPVDSRSSMQSLACTSPPVICFRDDLCLRGGQWLSFTVCVLSSPPQAGCSQ